MAAEKSKSQAETVRVTARIPGELYDALCTRRDETGVSINDLIVQGVAKALGLEISGTRKGIPGPKPKKR